MSTRSAVGYIPTKEEAQKGEKWMGIYSHFDGYPSGVGKEIWRILHDEFKIGSPDKKLGVGGTTDDHKSAQAFVDIYVKGHKGGWSSFGEKCYCHDKEFVMRDGVQESKLSSLDSDPLMIEFVYVVDPENLKLVIYEHKSVGDADYGAAIYDEPKISADGVWDYGHCKYKHQVLAEVDLLGEEPDWEKLEGQE